MKWFLLGVWLSIIGLMAAIFGVAADSANILTAGLFITGTGSLLSLCGLAIDWDFIGKK